MQKEKKQANKQNPPPKKTEKKVLEKRNKIIQKISSFAY